MNSTPYTPEQIGSLGEQLYQERIRALVEAGNLGKMVVIDVVSGDFEVAERDGVASQRLRSRHPEAVTYGLRIGYPTAYHIQGFFLPKEQ